MYVTAAVETHRAEPPRIDQYPEHVTLTVTEHVHGRDHKGERDGYGATVVHVQADSLEELWGYLSAAHTQVIEAIIARDRVRQAKRDIDAFAGTNISGDNSSVELAAHWSAQHEPGGRVA